jgi:hypothetical protein
MAGWGRCPSVAVRTAPPGVGAPAFSGWSCTPARVSDGPLGDGDLVLFELHGLSNLAAGSAIHVMTFKTTHGPHLWLNDVLALGEGSIDVDQEALPMRFYECIVTHRPGVPVTPPAAD